MTEQCKRRMSPGLDCVRLDRDGLAEIFITLSPLDGKDLAQMFDRMYGCLRRNEGSRILRQHVFGLNGRVGEDMRARQLEAHPVEWPVTWVEEGGQEGGTEASALAGIHVHALAGADIRPVRMDGRVVGTVFEDAHARYCFLGGIRPEDPSAPREKQTRACFEAMERALGLVEMDFSRVARTWLFLDDILAWYDGLNRARHSFFEDRGVFDGLVPASTGIGGSNPAGTAIVAEAIAVEPKGDQVRVEAVPSPLQCPALDYGSSFSRAVEIIAPDHRRLLVSGTASIDADGKTVHVGDVDRQVAHTMDVVQAILVSRGVGWPNVTRAIAYFKRAEDAPALDRYLAARGIDPLPVVVTKSDVCRDDLLYEVEVDTFVLT